MNRMNGGHVELEIEDSHSIELHVERENRDLTTHVDFDYKAEETEKKINFYVEVNAKMIQNLNKEISKLPSGFDDQRKLHHKNCIFVQKIQAPLSNVKGSFFLTYAAYKGLSIHVFLDFEDSDDLPYSRMKVHFHDDEKWRVKWLQCQREEKTFVSTIHVADLPLVLKDKLLVEIFLQKKRKVQNRFVGIENEGNTCYMNSILQVLFHLVPIRKIIVEKEIGQENRLLRSLQELFVALMTSKSSTNASKILQNFSAFCEYPYRQQDIHEFLMNFIDKLEEDCPELKYFWSGKDYEIIRSKDKRYESKQEQDFNELQLHMTDTLSNNFKDIKESLMALLKEENVEEMIETDKYGKLPVVKIRFFDSLPPILFMNVKRYEYNAKRRELSKICLDLDYPSSMNLDFLMKTPKKLEYILYAVTVHKGRTPSSGHYFSFINVTKDGRSPEWYEFNDSYVSRIQTEKIYQYTGKKKNEIYLNEKYGKWTDRSVYSEETAYLLVYMRKDLFNEYQTTEIKMPKWYLDREKRRLTEEEEKTKCVVRFHPLNLHKQGEFYPFSSELELSDAKLNKNESIENQFQNLQGFLGFKVGTVWRVNKKTQKIRYVGKKLGKYALNVDMLNRTKHGSKADEYFLILPSEKYISSGGNLGFVEFEEEREQETIRKIIVEEKKEIEKLFVNMEKEGKNICIQQSEMESFTFGWNDYLYVKVS